MFLKDGSFRYIIVNKRLREFLGRTEEEILNKTNLEIGWEDDANSSGSRDAQALSSSSIVVTGRAVKGRIYEMRRFAVRLGKNAVGVGGFARDITEAKKAEEELKVKSVNLEEVNAALRVLLKQRELDQNEMEERICSNVKKLVLPYLEKLRAKKMNDEQKNYLDILETNLNNIVSPFLKKMTSVYSNFTPTEILVADLIKDGKLSASLLSLRYVFLECER